MIDNAVKTEALLAKMRDALPIKASATSELFKMMQKQLPELVFSRECHITEIRYMGDEGGIMCHLNFESPAGKDEHIVSITHLFFDRKFPMSREIQLYQKHRIKRLKKLNGKAL